MKKNEIEKSLKKFLKNKVSYSISLLVGFMITGELVHGTTQGSKVLRSRAEVLKEIQAKRDELKRKIRENNKAISKYESEYSELMEKMHFYSKPLEASTNVILSTQFLDNGTMDDNTKNEFAETLKELSAKYDDPLEMLINNNGIIIDDRTYSETVDLGVAIETVNPKLPVLNLEVDVNVDTPVVDLGILPGEVSLSLNAPSKVKAPTVAIPTSPGNISVSVGKPQEVEKVTVTQPNVNVSIIPKDKTINTGNVSVSFDAETSSPIVAPNPTIPPEPKGAFIPNVSPFVKFSMDEVVAGREESFIYRGPVTSKSMMQNANISGGKFWSGVSENNGTWSIAPTAGFSGATGDSLFQSTSSRTYIARHPSIGYWNEYATSHASGIVSGGEFHVAGNVNNLSSDTIKGQGTQIFAAKSNFTLRNSDIYLYGKASVIGGYVGIGIPGTINVSDTYITIKGDDNLVFYTNGNAPYSDNGANRSSRYSVNLNLDVDLEVNTRKNTILGYTSFGANNIKLSGDIEINGSENIVASVLGWVPDKSQYIGKPHGAGTALAGHNYLSHLKMDSLNPVEIYGDENIGVLFSKIDPTFSNKKFNTGVYQGYTELYFNIGKELSSTPIFPDQKPEGQITNKPNYTSTTVDGSIGVFARTGQREGVDVMYLTEQDEYYPYRLTFFSYDQIHNLYMSTFDINFGKYSNNGVMFLAQNGTVIEILTGADLLAKEPTWAGNSVVSATQTSFTDGIMGIKTPEFLTSTRTIIAFAEGTWRKADTFMEEILGDNILLQSAPTEIIVGQELDMMSKEGIAFFGYDGGLVTVNADAEGHGYGSVMAYATNKATDGRDIAGHVEISAEVKAVDAGVTTLSEKYKNIGAYALNKGNILIKNSGSLFINGIGAFANGTNAFITFHSANNVINNGIYGGLVALNGGSIYFAGGNIFHGGTSTDGTVATATPTVIYDKFGDPIANAFDGKIAFYADDNGSKINFVGPTTINVYQGAVFYGEASDFDSGTTSSIAKYKNMSNVTVSLQANGLNLGVFKDQDLIWNSETDYLSSIGNAIGNATIISNGHWYSTALEGGTLTINSAVDLAAKGSVVAPFSNIVMEREKVIITETGSITSTIGQGLVLASNSSATTNTESGYDNQGTITINDATSTKEATGIYVSYGEVLNNGTIIAANSGTGIGTGVVGVNGSKIINNATKTITVGNASSEGSNGIVALATKSDDTSGTAIVTPDAYGTDTTDTTTKVIDVLNSGTITVNGTAGIGIYAENNHASATNTRTSVENAGQIIVGNSTDTASAIGISGTNVKIANNGTITVGEKGIGIYATGTTEITETGTFALGDKGIGIVLDGAGATISGGAMTIAQVGTEEKTAVAIQGNPGATIGLSIDGTGFETGTLLYADDTLTSSGTLTVGKDGVGIYISKAGASSENTGIINLATTSTGAVGMYTSNGVVKNSGTVTLNGASQVGLFAKGATATVENTGTMNLNGTGSVGMYSTEGATAKLLAGNNVVYGTATESIGTYTLGGTAHVADNLTFSDNNEKKNIYIYGKDSSGEAATVSIESGKTLNVNGVSTATTPGNKAIGIYIENSGVANTFTSDTASKTRAVNVTKEAIGIYSKGNNTLNLNVKSDGAGTIGVYIDGTSTVSGIVEATNDAVGIYGNGGEITVGESGINLIGAGMYLTGGATATGGEVTVSGTGGSETIGLYYSGTGTDNVTNVSGVKVDGSGNVGVYVDGGMTLTNTGKITASNTADTDNIGAYVGGESTLNSNATITMDDKDSIGLYVESGTGINNSTITMNGIVDDGSVVGMIAKSGIDAATSTTAKIENAKGGTVLAKDQLGMYIGGDGISEGTNAGTVEVTEGTAVYVDGTSVTAGSKVKFNNTGTLKVTGTGTGLYVKGTSVGEITSVGTLDISGGGVGVYAEDSTIDFNINVTGSGVASGTSGTSGKAVVGLAVGGGTVILNDIVTGDGSLGVYLTDNTSTFGTTGISKVTTGKNITESSDGAEDGVTSVGVFLGADFGAYSISNVDIDVQNGVGLYLTEKSSSGTGTQLIHSGNISTVGGVGIYVTKGNTLTTGATTINIEGGTGIYVGTGATANLGTTSDTLTFNFTNSGVGIYNENGTLNLGGNISIIGPGSLSATINGDADSSATLTIGEDGIGMLGTYDSAGPYALINKNDTAGSGDIGSITVTSGGIGMAGIKGSTDPTGTVTIENQGTISISGKESTASDSAIGPRSSIGIYTDVADIKNTGTINVGTDGIGIYSKHNGVQTTITVGDVNIDGTGAVGVYIKGTTNAQTLASDIDSTTATKSTGIVLDTVSGTVDVGDLTLTGTGNIGTLVTGAGATILTGTVEVGASVTDKSAIGVASKDVTTVDMTGIIITSGKKGIGAYVETTESAPTSTATVDLSKITVGEEGVHAYAKDSNLNFVGNATLDNKTGIFANGGSVTSTGANTMTVSNGGLGVYVDGSTVDIDDTTIDVTAGTSTDKSVGAYYKDVASLTNVAIINQTGNKTVGTVLAGTNLTTENSINIATANETEMVGVIAKENSDYSTTGDVTLGDGDKNIGVYADGSTVEIDGDLIVGNSGVTSNKSTSSIGVALKNGASYAGAGNLSVGDYSVGVYADGMTSGKIISQGNGSETMTLGKNAVGIYGKGTGGDITVNMSTGANTIGENSIGVYSIGTNANVTGNFDVGTNTAIGIASTGKADVIYTGDMTIADVTTTASVGILKINDTSENSNITTSGNFDVGKSGYGIFVGKADGATGTTTVNSSAKMTLSESSIGIYSAGKNTIKNNGTIDVGKTYVNPLQPDDSSLHKNSVGMYGINGSKVSNTGIINVSHKYSVGMYGTGEGTTIENVGTINVGEGAIGILAKSGVDVYNRGTINVGSAGTTVSASTYGIAAYGATVYNYGDINLYGGVGILKGSESSIANSGKITVHAGGTQIKDETASESEKEIGGIVIDPSGNVWIDDKYVSTGGTISAAGAIEVDGAYVDVTTNTPIFEADKVSGTVNILPNFIKEMDGNKFVIKDFVTTAIEAVSGTMVTLEAGPMFVTRVIGKDLVVVRKPYSDMIEGNRFEEFAEGLDNIYSGESKDKEILKDLDIYLSNLYASDSDDSSYSEAAAKAVSEMRGDVYATIQGRMQDINQVFDHSFYELEGTYNSTKNSGKFSGIYTDGNYKDPTVGIDDYDYRVSGLMYMKEKENMKFGNKSGYNLGFAVSEFDFDDAGSKEKVYSLRAGMHRVKSLGQDNSLSWMTRGELGYNRHETNRKLNLGDAVYDNDGNFDSYNVSFDNKLTKTLYSQLDRKLDVYSNLNLEYGKIRGFNESEGNNGGLLLGVKGNDYTSAEAGVGVKVSQKFNLGKGMGLKISADARYSYDFGNNYGRNEGKLVSSGDDYYDLVKPYEREGKAALNLGAELNKGENFSVSAGVEVSYSDNKDKPDYKYGVKFKYTF